jgi:LAS superfamily LD-carboxypeptidase LdcB
MSNAHTNKDWLGRGQPLLADAGASHRLHPQTLSAFSALQTAAQQEGIDLQIVSSFRDFDRQCAIWNRKWHGEAVLLDIQGKPLCYEGLSELQKMHAILTWSALPGTSRHHWGTDLDVYDKAAVEAWSGRFSLVAAEYTLGGPCYRLNQWLNQHMDKFDFVRPFATYRGGVAEEPWHLSHIPSANVFEQQRSLSSLVKAIEKSELAGKTTVLANIEEIYYRYVLNQGV